MVYLTAESLRVMDSMRACYMAFKPSQVHHIYFINIQLRRRRCNFASVGDEGPVTYLVNMMGGQ